MIWGKRLYLFSMYPLVHLYEYMFIRVVYVYRALKL